MSKEQGFKERFEEAERKGKTRELTHNIIVWEEPGQVLIGELIAIEDFTGGKYDTTVKKYTLETDDGVVSTILGAGADAIIKDMKLEGALIRIEYKGQKNLTNGRRCNVFKIEAV